MRVKIDREQRLKDEITRNTTTIHRVIKTVDGPEAETRQILYIGRDRAKARTAYHSAICKQNESILNDVVFDAGVDDFGADAVIETFSVKWGRK